MNKSDKNMARMIDEEEHFVNADSRKDQNAVYIEFAPEAGLEKLVQLASNENYPEKLQYVKHLAELIEIIGEPGYSKLNEIITVILKDTDEMLKALLIQITPLVNYFRKIENGYSCLIKYIVPTISNLINNTNYEIKEEAGQELSKLAPFLTEEDRGKHLLTIVLGMAHDDESEENRMVAVRLLSEMAPLFGKDLCEQFVGLEFLSMGEDPQLRVRKEAVTNLNSIGKIVSPYFFKQRLLPFYLRLCKDVNWGVRKSCIDTLYEISNICKDELVEHRESELTEAFLNFLKDPNKWVRISAYKNLGPFIFTLQGQKINEKLIDSYIHMIDSSISSLSPEKEILFACAYNFPAVLLTLGPSKWPTLSTLFKALLKSEDKMRKPLACSLHEIAKIIGEERAEKELLSVLESFLRDPNDEIKYGAIQNLALFLKVFKPEKRENMIDIFLELQKDQKKWRIRELIARQIDKLTMIFSQEITFRYIAPISFKLCNDPVAYVRDEAAVKIHALLTALYKSSDPIHRELVVENIKGFSQSNRYFNRQAFLLMMEKIMKEKEIFEKHFLENVIPLADDRVPNVRICLAKILKKSFDKNRPVSQLPAVIKLVKKMQNDKSRDVKALLCHIKLDHIEDKEEVKTQEEPNTQVKVEEPVKKVEEVVVEKKEEVVVEKIEVVKEEPKVEENKPFENSEVKPESNGEEKTAESTEGGEKKEE